MLKKEDIKKGLFRVKQLADQGLGRVEKSNVLSEDLQNAEKKVDVLKTVISNTLKKVTASLLAPNIADHDKRLKKYPAVTLASALQENCKTVEDGILGKVFELSATGQSAIGEALGQYELLVETSILSFLQHLHDVDIPAIKKTKAQLTKLTLDMDVAKRQQPVQKHQNYQSDVSDHGKSVTLEDAEIRVDTCKDLYAAEMHTFLSKESAICEKIILLIEAQADYHRACLRNLEGILPGMKASLDHHSMRPLYGCPLEEHLKGNRREIAFIIEECINFLYHNALQEEGLFRLTGGSSKAKKLKAAFNVGTPIDAEDYLSDVHAVAGSLKQYLRELPEPLLTFNLYEEFVKNVSEKDRESRLKKLWTTVKKLPAPNLSNVSYLIKFLARLAENSEANKMTPSNIAIVFGPNLLWPKDRADDGTDVVMSSVSNLVVETLVTQHEYFFPDDVSFGASKRNLNATGSESDMNSSVSSASQLTASVDTLNNLDVSTTSIMGESKKSKTNSTFNLPILNQINRLNPKQPKERPVSAEGPTDTTKQKKRKTRSLSSMFGFRGTSTSSTELPVDIVSGSEEERGDSQSVTDNNNDSSVAGNSGKATNKVVYKPGYGMDLPPSSDLCFMGVKDCPLADDESDGPLVIEPPTRSFPLTNPVPNALLHADRYDTAFMLAALKGDGRQYMNDTHVVLDNSYTGSLTSPRNSAIVSNCTVASVEVSPFEELNNSACMSQPSGSPTRRLSTFGSSSIQRSVSDTGDRPPLAVKRVDSAESTPNSSSPQASTSSLEGLTVETNKQVSSPSARRAKKAAPPPPKSPARQDSHKKPSGPPPARPSEPPPPTPDKTESDHVPLIDMGSSPTAQFVRPKVSTNPFVTEGTASEMGALNQLVTGVGIMSLNLSHPDLIRESSPQQNSGVSEPSTETTPPPVADKKTEKRAECEPVMRGHNRASSADLKPRVKPPPIPQRTHSVKTTTGAPLFSIAPKGSRPPAEGDNPQQLEQLLRKNSVNDSTPL